MSDSMFQWRKDEESVLYPFRKFMAGDVALLTQFVLAFIVVLFHAYVPGALFFGILLTLVLLLSDDVVSAFPTFMMALCFLMQAQHA